MKELVWTSHSRAKMRQYGLSEGRIKRVIHSPFRTEEGIAEGTVAMMQKAGSEKNPYELWVMVSDKRNMMNIVSAWKYPGVTKPGEPLPESIRRELREAAYFV